MASSSRRPTSDLLTIDSTAGDSLDNRPHRTHVPPDKRSRSDTNMADPEDLTTPLYCPLIVNGEEGKAASGRTFARENPADVRKIATVAELGTQEDARAAIDAARTAFDTNVGNWIYNGKLREQTLFRTAQLIRENADRLARVVSLEVGM